MMEFDKEIQTLKNSAEIIGIMLGDGGIYYDRGNKYQIVICFNKKESDYLDYLKNFFQSFFYGYKFSKCEIKSEYLLRNNSVFVGDKLVKLGLKVGNKMKNKIIIPNWIFQDDRFLLKSIKGLFDTDGCVYCKYGKYAQIQFKLGSFSLLNSIRAGLLQLKFNPTIIQ